MMWVFEGIELGKWTKRKTPANGTPSSHFRRSSLSLMSCSPAELTSVATEQKQISIQSTIFTNCRKRQPLTHKLYQ